MPCHGGSGRQVTGPSYNAAMPETAVSDLPFVHLRMAKILLVEDNEMNRDMIVSIWLSRT